MSRSRRLPGSRGHLPADLGCFVAVKVQLDKLGPELRKAILDLCGMGDGTLADLDIGRMRPGALLTHKNRPTRNGPELLMVWW